MPSTLITRTHPLFLVSLPILPPGINRTYMPATSEPGLKHTKAAQQFKKDVALLLSQWSVYNQPLIETLKHNKRRRRKTPLAVSIDFYLLYLWTRDVDGGIKAVLDETFHYIGLDDRLVVDLHVTKALDKENPRTVVSICCLVQPE